MPTDYGTILKELAPCGLDCARCYGYADGEIRKLAEALSDKLGNFAPVAERLSQVVPAFKDFVAFEAVLAVMTKASCTGCRTGGGHFPPCTAKTCFREKEVDFCFQCDEFPCERNRFDEALIERWKRNNTLMREIGVEAYYHKQKGKPRY